MIDLSFSCFSYDRLDGERELFLVEVWIEYGEDEFVWVVLFVALCCHEVVRLLELGVALLESEIIAVWIVVFLTEVADAWVLW